MGGPGGVAAEVDVEKVDRMRDDILSYAFADPVTATDSSERGRPVTIFRVEDDRGRVLLETDDWVEAESRALIRSGDKNFRHVRGTHPTHDWYRPGRSTGNPDGTPGAATAEAGTTAATDHTPRAATTSKGPVSWRRWSASSSTSQPRALVADQAARGGKITEAAYYRRMRKAGHPR